jgi:hypothetical protein
VVELKVHEVATVAFAIMLTGTGQATVSPVTGLTTEAKLTVPAKLNVLVRETDIEEPVAPELKLTGLLTEIVKSPTCTVDRAE